MPAAEASTVVSEIASFSRVIDISGTLRVVKDDPDDDAVLECAASGDAQYVVSGDHHILALGQYRSIKLVTATRLLAELPDTVED